MDAGPKLAASELAQEHLMSTSWQFCYRAKMLTKTWRGPEAIEVVLISRRETGNANHLLSEVTRKAESNITNRPDHNDAAHPVEDG